MSEANDTPAPNAKIEADRQMLIEANEQGGGAKLKTYVKMSGPGWLQSAITLGGGSLAGALFLGVLGGYSMLWIQMIAIIMGVIMLSAISYVTLSTGQKPFRAINEHINPALGWSWALATCTANMLWCMPQFSLSFEALSTNLSGGAIDDDSFGAKIWISVVLLALAMGVIWMNNSGGKAAKAFDWFLKALVGMVVICFFGVVAYMTVKGQLPWGKIFTGFIPNLGQWSNPAGDMDQVMGAVPAGAQSFWDTIVLKEQRAVMIGAAATAVGINMTFLLPYSMLNRGWDRNFRGLARFDLATGMAIPYVLVTSCVVIASAAMLHAQYDPGLLDPEKATPYTKDFQKAFVGNMNNRITLELKATDKAAFEALEKAQKKHDDHKKAKKEELGEKAFAEAAKTDPARAGPLDKELAKRRETLPKSEKELAAMLVRRKTHHLAFTLKPILGEKTAGIVFGIGVLGMGFSTIIILMLINGYVVCEMLGKPQGGRTHLLGCLAAGICGSVWPLVWEGPAKAWLAITVSAFGMMLLPIAYITFFFMMNSKRLMKEHKPQGASLKWWNALMGISVLGALVAAGSAVWEKSKTKAGPIVITLLIIVILAAIVGHFKTKARHRSEG